MLNSNPRQIILIVILCSGCLSCLGYFTINNAKSVRRLENGEIKIISFDKPTQVTLVKTDVPVTVDRPKYNVNSSKKVEVEEKKKTVSKPVQKKTTPSKKEVQNATAYLKKEIQKAKVEKAIDIPIRTITQFPVNPPSWILKDQNYLDIYKAIQVKIFSRFPGQEEAQRYLQQQIIDQLNRDRSHNTVAQSYRNNFYVYHRKMEAYLGAYIAQYNERARLKRR